MVTLSAGFLYALANEFFISIPVSCAFAQPFIALVSAPPLVQVFYHFSAHHPDAGKTSKNFKLSRSMWGARWAKTMMICAWSGVSKTIEYLHFTPYNFYFNIYGRKIGGKNHHKSIAKKQKSPENLVAQGFPGRLGLFPLALRFFPTVTFRPVLG